MDYSFKSRVDNTEVYYTENVDIDIDKKKKIIKIINKKNYENRVLFYGGSLSDWKIESNSLNKKNYNKKEKISYYSLTGCINIYKIKLKNINLKIDNSYCEDAVNIIYSSGNLKDVEIITLNLMQQIQIFQIFSLIKFIYIEQNDCIDYSSGNYSIKYANLSECLDKGISVGEKSNLYGEEIIIKNSKIGIAVKDSSTTKVKKYLANDV